MHVFNYKLDEVQIRNEKKNYWKKLIHDYQLLLNCHSKCTYFVFCMKPWQVKVLN